MSPRLVARRIGPGALPEVRARLGERPRENLLLLDLASRLGEAALPGEASSDLVGVWRGAELLGVASLRPTLVFDAAIEEDALGALLDAMESLPMGLAKSEPEQVGRLWERVSRRRRHRLWVDRLETALCLDPGDARLLDDGARVRRAGDADLEPLVHAARESLREEDRPDPFAGDALGFRRWVRGRVPRARVVEEGGAVRFAGYADVQRPEGWLLQGIYTWPDARRRGHAKLGTSALCREAIAAGADHVQLAVVDGNTAAERLYEGLGFKPRGRIRTILFT